MLTGKLHSNFGNFKQWLKLIHAFLTCFLSVNFFETTLFSLSSFSASTYLFFRLDDLLVNVSLLFLSYSTNAWWKGVDWNSKATIVGSSIWLTSINSPPHLSFSRRLSLQRNIGWSPNANKLFVRRILQEWWKWKMHPWMTLFQQSLNWTLLTPPLHQSVLVAATKACHLSLELFSVEVDQTQQHLWQRNKLGLNKSAFLIAE